MKNKHLFTLLIFIALLQACSIDALVGNDGDIVETPKAMPAIQYVYAHEDIAVHYHYDTVSHATIVCGKNIVDKIQFSLLSNNILRLHNYRGLSVNTGRKKAEVHIYCPSLVFVQLSDLATLTTHDTIKNGTGFSLNNFSGANSTINVATTKLNITNRRTADINLAGSTDNLKIDMMGTGYIFADKLQTNTCTINHNSYGNAYLTVNKALNCNILSFGNTYFKSTNDSLLVKSSIMGKGKLYKQ